MRQYRRNRTGQIFFFTLVTYRRRRILTTEIGRLALRKAIHEVKQGHPFKTIAIALLPDHIHAVWQLPAKDNDYSRRWRLIKSRFTRMWLEQNGNSLEPTPSRQRRGEQAIWQRRFYEHTCRDEADVTRCIEYTHINPVKHQLVNRVVDWPWSSFHRYVSQGYYPVDWGKSPIWFGDEFKHAE